MRRTAFLSRVVLALAAGALGACSDPADALSGGGGDDGGATDGGASDDGSSPAAEGGIGSPGDDAATPDTGTVAPDGGDYGDSYGPWAGGAAYYAKFTNGPPSDPSFFPISVWLQDPGLAAQYEAIGINHFVGLWNTPTTADLSTLAGAGMHAMVDQTSSTLSHAADTTLSGWTHQDEPDNAQPDGKGGYGPCIPASTIQSGYATIQKADATRPVFLNLGQGVGNTGYVGRGSCSGISDYPDYCKGADIVSFDLYPINDGLDLGDVPLGVDRLGEWVSHQKPVWNWLECTRIGQGNGKPTPAQVKTEVWMSIVHGSMGIGYFVHQFTPTEDDHALLDDAPTKAAVAAINQQIKALAPALNTPPIVNAAKVTTTGTKIDFLVKRQGGKLYVLAVSMGAAATTATIAVQRGPASKVTVLGENRQIAAPAGTFQDAFEGFAVHLYAVE